MFISIDPQHLNSIQEFQTVGAGFRINQHFMNLQWPCLFSLLCILNGYVSNVHCPIQNIFLIIYDEKGKRGNLIEVFLIQFHEYVLYLWGGTSKKQTVPHTCREVDKCKEVNIKRNIFLTVFLKPPALIWNDCKIRNNMQIAPRYCEQGRDVWANAFQTQHNAPMDPQAFCSWILDFI